VEHQGRLLVDGFLVGPVPVEAARTLGAELVVGVYLGTAGPVARPRHMGEVLWRSFAIMQQRALERGGRGAELLIAPEVSEFAWDDFSRSEEMIAAGEAATRAALPRLRELLTPANSSPARQPSVRPV
jgi:NTE family protein